MITLDQLDRRLKDSTLVIYDSETNGLDWRTNQIVGHVFTFSERPDDSWYFPVRHDGKNPYDAVKLTKMLKQHAANPAKRWGFHNAAFDLSMTAREGIVFRGSTEDTSINEALLDEYARSFSLDACCRRRGVQEKKGDDMYKHLASKFGGEPIRDQMGNFWKLPADDALAIDYATGDGTSTWQLLAAQQPLLDADELRTVWDVECRLIKVLHKMSSRGIRIDEERLAQVVVLVENSLERARKEIPEGLNERSPKQMEKLFTDAGIGGWPITPKGNPSFPEAWLLTNPIGQKIVRARKFANLLNSFLLPLRDRHLYRGRVHPEFHQTRDDDYGTVTGRLSASNPNTHQAHRRNKEMGALLRSIFVPDDGMLWNSGDLSQCEPRLLAHYSKCRVLLDGYLSDPPIDAHSAVAKSAGIDRESGKRLNQAMITGAGMDKIAAMLEMPRSKSDLIANAYFTSMPEIKDIQRDMKSVMMHRGYIKTILGRRCRLDDQRFAYKALNRALQGSNADIIKKAMVDIDDEFGNDPDIQLLNNVHDDLCQQYAPGSEDKLKRTHDIFTDFGPGRAVELRVPMEVNEKSGPNWAEATWDRDTVAKVFQGYGVKY